MGYTFNYYSLLFPETGMVSTTTLSWTTNTFTDTLNITPYEMGGTSATGWCIHLPSQITEQRMQPGGASLTHTTSFVANQHSECEVDSSTVEPTSNTDKVVTALVYDGCGNLNSISITGQNPDGTSMTPARQTTASYGSHCIFPETITNALTQAGALGYDYTLSVLTSASDPNILTTSWTYNDIGQKTLEHRPDGTQTSYGLTACVSHCGSSTPLEYYLVTQEQDSTGGHATFRQHYDYYDQLDRVIKDQVQISGGQYADTWSTYDSLGRLAQKSSPYMDGATQYFTTYHYDLLNRTTSMSRPISATNSTLEYTYYTYQGRTATVQDPKTYTKTTQSDVIGEVGIVTDPDGTSKTTYTYDPFSHLTQIKDPANNQTNLTYDSLGYLLTNSSDPDRGAWTYQFDSLGELINLRDAKTNAPSWTQTLTWDVLGRTTQRIETEGTTVWTWGTVAANHEIGRLKELSGLNDDELYTYDSAGRPATHSMTWASSTYTVSANYNTLGKLNELIYPVAPGQANPFAVLYSYSNGYLSSLQNYTGSVAGTTFWKLSSGVPNMDSWGHVIDETLGTTSAVRIQSAFDGVTSWLNTRTVGSGGSLNNLQNLAYQWDLNGNLGQRADQIQSLTEAFSYDNLNRIQTSTLNGNLNLQVAIDNTGNITSRTEGGVTYPYTYDTTHKHAVDIVGTSPNQTTYSYDANGNMATRNGYSLTWASYNLPTNINGASGVYSTLYYGPDRQRKEQVAKYVSDGQNGTETTIYVFGLYEYEMTPAQTHNKYFVQVPGGTQVVYDIQSVSGTQTTYITADHLGSGNLLISSAGTVEINENYSAFGYRRSANWAGPLSATSSDYTTIASTTRRGYTDAFHEMLDNVGLIHMNGRVYDPTIGRFLSPDPVITEIGDSQRGNPYSYVENGALTQTDPSGFGCPDNTQCWDQPLDPNYEADTTASYGGAGSSQGGQQGYQGGWVWQTCFKNSPWGDYCNAPVYKPDMGFPSGTGNGGGPGADGPGGSGPTGPTQIPCLPGTQCLKPSQPRGRTGNPISNFLCLNAANNALQDANNVFGNATTAADLAKPLVELGAMAAGVSRALGPYGEGAALLGDMLASGLGKLGSIGKASAGVGLLLDLATDLNGLVYDSADFVVYGTFAAGGAAGFVETGGGSAAAAIMGASAYFGAGGSKGIVQGALCKP